jgi:hypothetical protein
METHHICDNKHCVNPGHLLPVSPQEHHAFHTGIKPDILSPARISARNARIVALARERRNRDPAKARAQARAKYARRTDRDREGPRARTKAKLVRRRQRKQDLAILAGELL